MSNTSNTDHLKEYLVSVDEGKTISVTVRDCWVSPMVTCLCNKCAIPYLIGKNTKLVRVDKNQTVYDDCVICSRKGLDYVIFERTA